jgi:DNA-binding Xre family transcriptional regulator
MTAYGLASASAGRISLSQAYRLAADEWTQLPRETIASLCEILEVQPGDLFEQVPGKGKRG